MDQKEQIKLNEQKKVFVKTFGCQMNEYDTEKMLMLLSKDYIRVDTMEEADLAIVNTCSVREKGEHKLYGMLGRLRKIKEEIKPDLVIGVGGCVAQQEGENILRKSPSVDFVVGTHNLSLVPSLVRTSIEKRVKQVAIDFRDEWEELDDEFDALPDKQSIVRSAFNSSVRALVAIQRGCDKVCTYCVVPGTRGRQVSRDVNEILKEIRLKVRMGAREVMLLGQTVNSFGVDLTPRVKFSELVKRVSDIDGVKRIRFTSPHPAEVKRDFLELYKDIPSLCPHIHLPLQSGNNRVLRAMNRNYKVERYLDIVESLKNSVPGIALSTDIIVGFPGETDSEFMETIKVVESVRYHSCYSFKYSIRPNTSAKEIYTDRDEVPEDIKNQRLQYLQSVQDSIGLEINNSYMNGKVELLVETGPKEISSEMNENKLENQGLNIKSYRGRTLHNVPIELLSVDNLSDQVNCGDIILANVVRASPHGLRSITDKYRKILLSKSD
ncbi:MAG TPA: tRNA (N6-isopentenyl adenosine(37)-C2)-methylthiotransferase MiaB [Oligoflexia bacterium]|nr:tRNA (N6-isopentenyl adenosine(37)-C2)-methylthiotransferase MiaB [Oligoflexia bacterium]HMP47968.1 tRNA (N6-isopentenyl adenosine(37)-C2)-methylthiotransferase MiaB [Oligoflexia bacterium]